MPRTLSSLEEEQEKAISGSSKNFFFSSLLLQFFFVLSDFTNRQKSKGIDIVYASIIFVKASL
jgi:hypothetical protein